MAIRIIRTGTDPVLRDIAKPVPGVTRAVEKLLDDMADTMYDAEGVGLAAVQIGVLKRLIVIDVGDGLLELINPEFVDQSGSQQSLEGCLSLPGIRADVARFAHVKVRAMNRKGDIFEVAGDGLLAFCLQHEMDHLNGILITDRVKPSELIYENEESGS